MYSYEEIRSAVIDLLAEREKGTYPPTSYDHLMISAGEILSKRSLIKPEVSTRTLDGSGSKSLQYGDRDKFREVFWDLFRQGIITLGRDDANRDFPWCSISSYGRRILENQESYFFHDVSTYENLIHKEIPKIDPITMIYLKEAMQSFRVGCHLSSSVMLGVAAEHSFDLMIETINSNSVAAQIYSAVSNENSALRRINKFRRILETQLTTIPRGIKEDLDTTFAGIISIIRTFRNESGHPSGKIIDREQCYILLQLFIPYCRKMYNLMDHFAGVV